MSLVVGPGSRLAPLIARALRAGAYKLEADANRPSAMIVVDAHNQIQNLTIEGQSGPR